MMKMRQAFMALAMLLMATTAQAGSGSKVKSFDVGGYLAPEMANDGVRLDANAVGRTDGGDLVVCPQFRDKSIRRGDGTCTYPGGRNAWVYPEEVPPHGLKLAYFRILSNGSSEYYEFYWRNPRTAARDRR